jgi:hypothetical protein
VSVRGVAEPYNQDPHLGVFGARHWARVSARICAFDERRTADLCGSAPQRSAPLVLWVTLSAAWNTLSDSQLKDPLHDLHRHQESGTP